MDKRNPIIMNFYNAGQSNYFPFMDNGFSMIVCEWFMKAIWDAYNLTPVSGLK